MTGSSGEWIEEHLRRFHNLDGNCLNCRRPANRHHPVGPITIAISDPDGDEFTHEFAAGVALAIGPQCRLVACLLLTGIDCW
jgi:hypothetical protein